VLAYFVTKFYPALILPMGAVDSAHNIILNFSSRIILVFHLFIYLFIHSFIHSIAMCRMRRFLAVLRSFFHSSLLYTFSCHSSPQTILQFYLTSSCHLFLGLPLGLVDSKFTYILLGILFSSILCTCPSQRNLYGLNVSVTVDILKTA
jgi:hypothetical protein